MTWAPLNIGGALDSPRPTMDFVLPGLLAGSVGLLSGPGGLGKSMLLTQLAVDIAQGLSPLNGLCAPQAPARVVQIVGEETALTMTCRLHDVTRCHGNEGLFEAQALSVRRELLAQNLHIYPLGGSDVTVMKQGRATERLKRLCEISRGCRLVIIDPLRRVHTGDENSSADMTRVVQAFEHVAKSTGAAVILTHHTNKFSAFAAKGDYQQAARGSSALTDGVRWQANLILMDADEARALDINEVERSHYVKAAHTSGGIRYDRRIDFDRTLGWSHAVRVSSRATALVAGLSGTTPAELLDAVQTACAHMTPDMRKAAQKCVRQKIARRLASILRDSWPYRTSASGWAGGQHSVEVLIDDEASAAGWSTRVWSSNGKWSGTNSSAQLVITESCVRTLGYLLIEGGLIAVDTECLGNREYRVVWVEQSRGFDLKLVEGWLIRGYHVAGGTLEKARNKAAKARVQQAIERRAARLQGKVDSGHYDLRTVMVSRGDSIKAGNCVAGTRAFMKRFEQAIAGRKALPADELLRLERSPYSLAAVTYALARTQRSADIATSDAS